MGSGDWFKNMVRSKKLKNEKSKKLKQDIPAPENLNDFKENNSPKVSSDLVNGASIRNTRIHGKPSPEIAATRIQSTFRAYVARKAFRHLKGMVRLQKMTQGQSVKKQASTTLSYLHSWSRIQAQIRARRISMVTEGKNKQKKMESQLKLEAKLHDLEVEWSAGSETMDEVLAKIHYREEAAVKRERALAYAFSHQWRANSNTNFGPCTYELSKGSWGWSWVDRWIAARPWEGQAVVQSSPKKTHRRQASHAGKNTKSPSIKLPNSNKTISPNAKRSTKGRRLSFTEAEKPEGGKIIVQGSKTEEETTQPNT